MGVVVFALFQLGAWWVNAHDYARVGLLDEPALWSPPLGWRVWLVLAVVGAAAIALAAAVGRSASLRGRHGGRPVGVLATAARRRRDRLD